MLEQNMFQTDSAQVHLLITAGFPSKKKNPFNYKQMSFNFRNVSYFYNATRIWPEENWPPTEPGFSKGFFLHSVT